MITIVTSSINYIVTKKYLSILIVQKFNVPLYFFRFNYGRLVIYLGLLFSNLEKAISYGDGDRESLCLKLTIPIFRRMGRTKYAQSMVGRVVMIKSVLSEADSYEYRHNTTIGKQWNIHSGQKFRKDVINLYVTIRYITYRFITSI